MSSSGRSAAVGRASASVERVRAALAAAGFSDAVVELEQTARSAEDAALAVGCEAGAIVKSLVFVLDGSPVMALVAGDRRCDQAALSAALGGGVVRRADADLVREATGFAIGGVSPLGLIRPLPVVIDGSLWRFPTIWAAAGHPHCVFSTTPDTLHRLTSAIRSDTLGSA